MQIEGSVALVTGGNRGIGREFVRELLARGGEKVYASILARAAIPACGSAAASKAATLSMTQCVRAELTAQGTPRSTRWSAAARTSTPATWRQASCRGSPPTPKRRSGSSRACCPRDGGPAGQGRATLPTMNSPNGLPVLTFGGGRNQVVA